MLQPTLADLIPSGVASGTVRPSLTEELSVTVPTLSKQQQQGCGCTLVHWRLRLKERPDLVAAVTDPNIIKPLSQTDESVFTDWQVKRIILSGGSLGTWVDEERS